jgi:hypothetical protein
MSVKRQKEKHIPMLFYLPVQIFVFSGCCVNHENHISIYPGIILFQIFAVISQFSNIIINFSFQILYSSSQMLINSDLTKAYDSQP